MILGKKNCFYLHKILQQKLINFYLKINLSKMESTLDKTINEIMATPNTTAVLFADKQGLVLGSKGNISNKAGGMAIAISELACKLEPNNNPPVIALDYGDQTCLIHKYGGLTGVIYKQTPGSKNNPTV